MNPETSKRWVWIYCAAMLGACDSSSGPGPGQLPDAAALDTASGADAHAVPDQISDVPLPTCGTAAGSLPAGVVVLSWGAAESEAATHIREQTFSITVNDKTYEMAQVPLYEAVRFHIEHPSRILGFAVRWANVPSSAPPELELKAGLYADFGHNGFDFWKAAPLREGTRCAADHGPGQWLSYALDDPLEVLQPGLIYVGHLSMSPADPVFAFDTAHAAASCEAFDACHSAINLPDSVAYENGISFSFQYDFQVRLFLEVIEELDPTDRLFAEVSSPAGKQISWGDYNTDGWDDALIDGRLHRNIQGTLTDVNDASGIGAAPITPTGGIWGDYDNDGCLDLLLYVNAFTAADVLMRSNCDGTFSDVTAAAELTDLQTYNSCGDPANTRSPTVAAAWLDLDADGLLDLYLANYSCGADQTYYVDTIFQNQGDGTFAEWTEQHGFTSVRSASRGAAPVDFDGDGDVDLFVNNYRLQANLLYENNGDGTVTERAVAAGLAGVPPRWG